MTGASVKWFSDRSVSVRGLPPHSLMPHLAQRARSLGVPMHIRAGMESVLVETDSPSPDLRTLVESWINDFEHEGRALEVQPRYHRFSVRYDGVDLAEVSHVLGMEPETLIAAHTNTEWTVAMLGFAPGFGYLIPATPHPWGNLPRRQSPRPRVPRGSVALAAGMSAVYPSDLPGGWHIIGTTDTVLFDPINSEDPAVLHPGDIVRFTREDR